ncbi:ryanodine receptor Ryr, partial [Candidatus Acetothermia bacterium]|nr:ryanodine receptor Ryr [Candidatus Acetothermia bacterium]
IHEEYVRSEREKGFTPETNPAMVFWKELPEDLKESNRAQAEHIRVKLQAIGCDIGVTTDRDPPLFELSPEEVELLSKMEHERFVEERLRSGWTLGPAKNIEKKISPTLIPWKELSNEEKEKDRMFVRRLPAFLAEAGFQIHRLSRKT